MPRTVMTVTDTHRNVSFARNMGMMGMLVRMYTQVRAQLCRVQSTDRRLQSTRVQANQHSSCSHCPGLAWLHAAASLPFRCVPPFGSFPSKLPSRLSHRFSPLSPILSFLFLAQLPLALPPTHRASFLFAVFCLGWLILIDYVIAASSNISLREVG